jgi:hypothetical protein
MTFIDELIAESEVRDEKFRIEMNKLRADQCLAAIAILEDKAEDVNALADSEIHLIEEYRQTELAKLNKRISWLEFNLEIYMRSTNEKSLALPHGELKLRLGRPKLEITNLDLFKPVAEKKGLLRSIAEPDLLKIHAYLKNTNISLPGLAVTPAQVRFSYKTKGRKNADREATTSQTGATAEPDLQPQALEG